MNFESWLTLTGKHSSDIWIDEDGKKVEGDDEREEDEEAGDGAAGDEDEQIRIVQEIFDALHGHVGQTRKLTKKVEKYCMNRIRYAWSTVELTLP